MPEPPSAPDPAPMTVERLTNEQWGIQTNCFVCEPTNPDGLQLPFSHDTDTDEVVATFALGEAFSGAPNYLHGGVVLAVLDEAMAWAAIACGGKWAVTTETTTRFHRPVRVGRRYEVRARVCGVDGDRLSTSAEVLDAEGRPRVESTATFQVLTEAQAVDAAGDEAAVRAHADHLA